MRPEVSARLARAFPELDGHARTHLERRASRARSLQLRGTRHALRVTDVQLCRALTFVGWEHLHAAAEMAAAVLHLPSPWGSPSLATESLRIFRPGLGELVPEVGLRAAADVPGLLADGEEFLVRWNAEPWNALSWSARLAHAASAALLPVCGEVTKSGGWRVEWLAPVVPRPGDPADALEERCRAALREHARKVPELWPWENVDWI